jgi:hypothetical protein
MSHLIIKKSPLWLRNIIWTAVAIVVVAGAWGAYRYGHLQAYQDEMVHQQAIDQLEQVRLDQETTITRLREEKAVLERSSKVEKEAYRHLDVAMSELQNQLLALEEENAFYRGIVSPGSAREGLNIESFVITSGSEATSFHYKLVLTQVLNNSYIARGSIALAIEGTLNGTARSLEWKALASDLERQSRFKFRYFQNMEGDILLPEGFKPTTVNITVLPKGNKYKKLEKSFDWSIAEN